MPYLIVPPELAHHAQGERVLFTEGRTVGEVVDWLRAHNPALAVVWLDEAGALRPALAARIRPDGASEWTELSRAEFAPTRPLEPQDSLLFGTPRRLQGPKWMLVVAAAGSALGALILSGVLESGSSALLVADVLVGVCALSTTAVLGLLRVNPVSTTMILILLGVFGGILLSKGGGPAATLNAALLCPEAHPILAYEYSRYEPVGEPEAVAISVIPHCVNAAGEGEEDPSVNAPKMAAAYAGVYGGAALVLVLLFRLLRAILVRRLGPASDELFRLG